MDKLQDLKDLLKHEIEDLYSVEEQIISALPKMIEKANHPDLKKALRDHLRVTEAQKKRLDTIQKKFNAERKNEGDPGKVKGFLSNLFGGAGSYKCKGMEGLIEEGEKIMGEDMNGEVLDAAIIASAQKIEHYEICGYGTARAYARELRMPDVEKLLSDTLAEEYQADDLLTRMAVSGGMNREAEKSGQSKAPAKAAAKKGTSSSSSQSSAPAKKSETKTAAPKKSAAKKSAPKKKAKAR